jgi:tRNA G10  N-methylase Trm11
MTSEYEEKCKIEGEEFLVELKALLKKFNAEFNLEDEGTYERDAVMFVSSSGDMTYDENRRVGFDIRLGRYFTGD